MTRPLWMEFEDAAYHLASWGNVCQDIFLDDNDREGFLKILAHVIERYGWICHAYCLMGNHYRLLIETPGDNLSRGMQLLNGFYTQRFNHRHKRVGHVLQGRFKSILLEKENRLLELARYYSSQPSSSEDRSPSAAASMEYLSGVGASSLFWFIRLMRTLPRGAQEF